MNLESVAADYASEHETGLAQNTKDWHANCVMCFRSFLGHEPTVADLTRETVNRYVDWMAANRAIATARSQRGGLLTLWRYAADEGICELPRKIRKLRKPVANVRAWTPGEVQRLRDHCLSLPGVLSSGIPKAVYFGSLVQASYETGLRRADQLSLERDWIRMRAGEGCITIVEHKTGKKARRVLTRDTMRLIDKCMLHGPKERRLIWPLWTSMDAFSRMMARIIKSSGVSPGSFKYLRRSACTSVEMVRAGSGQVFLNHSDPTVTRDSYLDEDQIFPEPLRVPPLGKIG